MTLAAAHDAYFDLPCDATCEAICAFEDGDADSWRAFLATATATQRRHFEEMAADVERKWARSAVDAAPRSTRAARNAAAAIRDGSHAAEERILARQGF